jgi:hypothetical protein
MLDSSNLPPHECTSVQYVNEIEIKIMLPAVKIFVLSDHAVLQGDSCPANYEQDG